MSEFQLYQLREQRTLQLAGPTPVEDVGPRCDETRTYLHI